MLGRAGHAGHGAGCWGERRHGALSEKMCRIDLRKPQSKARQGNFHAGLYSSLITQIKYISSYFDNTTRNWKFYLSAYSRRCTTPCAAAYDTSKIAANYDNAAPGNAEALTPENCHDHPRRRPQRPTCARSKACFSPRRQRCRIAAQAARQGRRRAAAAQRPCAALSSGSAQDEPLADHRSRMARPAAAKLARNEWIRNAPVHGGRRCGTWSMAQGCRTSRWQQLFAYAYPVPRQSV